MTQELFSTIAAICFLSLSAWSLKMSYAPINNGNYIRRRITLFYLSILLFFIGLNRILAIFGIINIEQQRLINTFVVMPVSLLILLETNCREKKHKK